MECRLAEGFKSNEGALFDEKPGLESLSNGRCLLTRLTGVAPPLTLECLLLGDPVCYCAALVLARTDNYETRTNKDTRKGCGIAP
jgi:hypothetical protein